MSNYLTFENVFKIIYNYSGDVMKYGMPTLVEFDSILENVKFAKENNLDFIELNMDLPYCFNIKENETIKL